MTRRNLLRSQLTKAWKESINGAYKQQRINSERSLQASIWSELNKLFSDIPRRMFIEPSLSIHEKNSNGANARKHRIPDLVICNSVEIIGIVEMKYQPRGKPDYKKDLETLEWIADHAESLTVSNARYRGKETDAKPYKLSKSVVYVWAGVHSDATVSLPIPEKIKYNFLELHAVTGISTDPKLIVRSKYN